MITNEEIKKMKSVEIIIKRDKKMVKKNAYTVSDKEFIEWVVKRIKATYTEYRLKFRLELLKLIKKVL